MAKQQPTREPTPEEARAFAERYLQRQAAAQDRILRRIVTGGLLLAITLLLTFTSVGFIPVPTPAGSATIAHIPTIIGGILEGPLVGLMLAFGFGLGSIFSPLVPVKDPLVIVLPRLAIGVVAWAVYLGLRQAKRGVLTAMLALLLAGALYSCYQIGLKTLWLGIVVGVVAIAGSVWLYFWMHREDVRLVALAVAAVAGSLANTIPVLTAAVWRKVLTPDVALGIGLAQGIPEAIVSGIVVVAVVAALRQIGKRKGSRL